MREKFWGYIPPNEKDFKELWSNASFFLDANILLDLYRYSSDSRAKSFELFENLRERVFITEVSLAEFFKHRQNAYFENKNIKTTLCQNIDFDQIRRKVSEIRNSLFDNKKAIKIVDKFESDLHEYLDEIELKMNNNGDKTLDRIVELFDGSVINNFNEQQLNEKIKEGEIRFKNKIPPGYEDSKKESDEKYNDYITWELMIKYALDKKKNIIFVTEDTKEDWIKSIKKKKVGPREELLNEFYKRTNGMMIYIYTTSGFIEGYKKNIEDSDVDKLLTERRELDTFDSDQLININHSKKWINYVTFLNNKGDSISNYLKRILTEQEKELVNVMYMRDSIREEINMLLSGENFSEEDSDLINQYERELGAIETRIGNLKLDIKKNRKILYGTEE